MTRLSKDFESWLAERINVADCWEWKMARHRGYGVAWGRGRTEQAHRLIWEELVGAVPDGLELDHLCRNRACVNPDHLEPVTAAENGRRGAVARINRDRAERQTHCVNGHSLIDAYRRSSGYRICRTCVSIRNKRRYA